MQYCSECYMLKPVSIPVDRHIDSHTNEAYWFDTHKFDDNVICKQCNFYVLDGFMELHKIRLHGGMKKKEMMVLCKRGLHFVKYEYSDCRECYEEKKREVKNFFTQSHIADETRKNLFITLPDGNFLDNVTGIIYSKDGNVIMNENNDNKYIVVIDPYVTYPDAFASKRCTYSFEQAQRVAQSLAAKNPGKKYYVAKLEGYATTSNAQYYNI